MAGKVLTTEDFEKSGDPTKEDTSSQTISADQKFDQDGKAIVEEPEKVETSKEEVKVEPLSKPSDEFKPKHKSWEETEKARMELERGFTEKSMKASELEKKLAQYERPVEKPKTIDDQIRELTKKTLKEINSIPADAPNRDEDAGFLWAKLTSDVDDIKYEARTRHQDTERQIITKTYERAQKEGIKTDAELRILGFEFSKADASLGSDDRINQAIESTKGILSQIREGFIKSQEQDKRDKDDLKVLGRGSTRKESKETKETKPTTMSQQLAELNEKRRMTKEDLR